MKKPIIIGCIAASALCWGNVNAQEAAHGTINAGAGVGTAAPWEGDVKLTIPTSIARISPYLNIEGISHQSSGVDDDRFYRYSKSGNIYESNQQLQSEGFDLKYGTTAIIPLSSGNINMMVEGQHHQQETSGWLDETVFDANRNTLSLYRSNIAMPHVDWDQYRAGAGYTHQGFLMEYAY